MNWGINLKPEDDKLKDIKRRASEAQDWTLELGAKASMDAISSFLTTRDKRRDHLDDVAQYTGIAAGILNIIESTMPKALEKLGSHKGNTEEARQMVKVMLMTEVVKGIVDNADKIKQM